MKERKEGEKKGGHLKNPYVNYVIKDVGEHPTILFPPQ